MKHERRKPGPRPAQAQKAYGGAGRGGMRPALYYTNQGQAACAKGVVEAPHTVAHRVKSKEESPRGIPCAAGRASASKRAGGTHRLQGAPGPFCFSHKHRVPAAGPACFIFLLSSTARRRPPQAAPARKYPQSLPACGRRPAAPCRPASCRRPFSAACGASCASWFCAQGPASQSRRRPAGRTATPAQCFAAGRGRAAPAALFQRAPPAAAPGPAPQ